MRGEGAGTVVVGGGIIGAMCAWYLARAGERVCLVDRDRFGGGCSHGNCGYVCPSHVLPLTQPGTIRKTLATMLRRDAPFHVRPAWSPQLWAWLWRFARRCNERDMLAAADSLHRLLQSSRDLYAELIADERLDCEWQTSGLLLAFRDPREFRRHEATHRLIEHRYGLAARPLEGDQVVGFEPALIEGLGGGWYYDCDSHLRPDKLLREMRRLLLAAGVRIVEHCAVRGFRTVGERVAAVETSGEGVVAAERVVVACGALTPFLNEQAGCRVAIQPGKGYSLTMPRPAICPRRPLVLEERSVAITPMDSGYRIGSTMEFAGYDSTLDPRRLRLLTDGARAYLREPLADPVQETWFGWRPMTWDSLPYIGRSPRYANVWVAAGHNMLGLSLATATGRLAAELATGRPPHLDVRPLRLDR